MLGQPELWNLNVRSHSVYELVGSAGKPRVLAGRSAMGVGSCCAFNYFIVGMLRYKRRVSPFGHKDAARYEHPAPRKARQERS